MRDRLEPGKEWLHPVESVSWEDCERVLAHLGLELPTEAQWERAARAGTGTPWWTGAEKRSLEGAANLTDRFATRLGAKWSPVEEWLDDGHGGHAPVGSYAANPFGLHDTAGNVWEWCRDGYGSYELPVAPDTGERIVEGATERVSRGGSFNQDVLNTRSAARTLVNPDSRIDSLGLRPARAVER
jgi:formylglycine-generating enzyme required for sulfatase activity